MAAGELKEFRHIRLEPAENGWVLDFTEVRTSVSGGNRTFDDTDWFDKQIVFKDDEADAAFAKMKELHIFNKVKKAGNKPDPIVFDVAPTMKSSS